MVLEIDRDIDSDEKHRLFRVEFVAVELLQAAIR